MEFFILEDIGCEILLKVVMSGIRLNCECV